MARKFFVGGNFKMNGSKTLISSIVHTLKAGGLDPNVEVVIGVPFPYLGLAAEEVKGSAIEVAAENAYVKESGAYTGEVSPQMIKDCGATWVILGHSERRQIFKESSEFIAEKTKFALGSGVSVILCIGETREERDAGKTLDVCTGQLAAAIKELKPHDWKNIVVAYEPVWAIGTGLTATPADAQKVHADIRSYLSSSISPEVAEETRIIYGGSVNSKTSPDLSKEKDIDGFLVGGASLKPEFVQIINVAKL